MHEKVNIFKTCVTTVSTNTPHVSLKCKFYEQDIFARVYNKSCPKIASLHRFWLKGLEELWSTTKFEHVPSYERKTPVPGCLS